MRSAVAGLVLLAAAGCSARDDAPRPATIAPTAVSGTAAPAFPSPASNVTATAIAESTPRWKVGETMEIGPGPGQLDVVLYIEQGCTQCDGPPVSIERVWRDAAGAMQRQILFRTPPGSRYLTSTAVGGDGTLYATACFGECAEVGSFVDDGYSVIYASADGGETWRESERSPSARRFIGAAMPDGQLILMIRRPQVDGEPPPAASFWTYPGGLELVPPLPNTYPEVTAAPAQPVVWSEYESGKVFRPDGTLIDVPAFGAGSGNGTPRTFGSQPPSGLALVWLDTRAGRRDWHYSFVEGGEPTRDYLGDDSTGFPWVEIWLDEDRAVGRMNYSTPALFDFRSATVHPIRIYDPQPGEPFVGRNRIVGYRIAN